MIAISSFSISAFTDASKPIGSIKSDRISYYFRYNFIWLALSVDVQLLILLNKQDYSFDFDVVATSDDGEA